MPPKSNKPNVKKSIKEAAKKAYILISNELEDRIMEEICKLITPEFVNKIRETLIKEKEQKPKKLQIPGTPHSAHIEELP